MGGLLGKRKSSRPEEVWRQDSQFENRLAQQHHPDTWGGVTSYNLLDLQDIKHVSPYYSREQLTIDLDENNTNVIKIKTQSNHSPDTLFQSGQKTFKLFIRRRHISISFLLPLLGIGIPVSIFNVELPRILSCKDINPAGGSQSVDTLYSVLILIIPTHFVPLENICQ